MRAKLYKGNNYYKTLILGTSDLYLDRIKLSDNGSMIVQVINWDVPNPDENGPDFEEYTEITEISFKD